MLYTIHMFSFLSDATTEHAALLVDVGSGSVGIALVHYTNQSSPPVILWSHREYAGITDTVKQPVAKVIKTALLQAFLEFDSTGRKQLPEHLTSRDILHTQVLINAPWVFTITKTVSFSQEHNFTITDSLVTELEKAARTDTEEAIATLTDTLPEHTQLQVIDGQPIMVIANGYQTTAWQNTTARSLKIDYLTSLSHVSIIETVEEMHGKIVPNTTLSMHAHIAALYKTMRSLHPAISELCLVDITTEGTEIGMVRNGVLRHVTSVPYGSYTIAREIATAMDVPTEEALGYLQNPYSELRANKKALPIIDTYEAALSQAFTETGDELLVPKTVYTHVNQAVVPVLKESLTQALQSATDQEHIVHSITSEILKNTAAADTNLLIATEYYRLQQIGTDNAY